MKLELRNISKRFGAVTALHSVSMSLRAGEILGLLGDNGAGKSTLIKILSGFHQPTSGQLMIDGQEVRLESPRHARALGIETVYQDLGLIEQLSISRNFFLGRELTRSFGLLNHSEMNRAASEALAETGVRVRDPRSVVKNLSGGERQAIAIGRAWYFGNQILILDEPTSALSIQETKKVFHYMQQARKKGMSVIFITHNLAHAQTVCDRLFVIHHGRGVGEFPPTVQREILERIITHGSESHGLGNEGALA